MDHSKEISQNSFNTENAYSDEDSLSSKTEEKNSVQSLNSMTSDLSEDINFQIIEQKQFKEKEEEKKEEIQINLLKDLKQELEEMKNEREKTNETMKDNNKFHKEAYRQLMREFLDVKIELLQEKEKNKELQQVIEMENQIAFKGNQTLLTQNQEKQQEILDQILGKMENLENQNADLQQSMKENQQKNDQQQQQLQQQQENQGIYINLQGKNSKCMFKTLLLGLGLVDNNNNYQKLVKIFRNYIEKKGQLKKKTKNSILKRIDNGSYYPEIQVQDLGLVAKAFKLNIFMEKGDFRTLIKGRSDEGEVIYMKKKKGGPFRVRVGTGLVGNWVKEQIRQLQL